MQAIICVYIQNYKVFKERHRQSVGKVVCPCKFTVPELKIIFVLFYILAESTSIWIFMSISAGTFDTFYQMLRSYADCMVGGNRKYHDCHMLKSDIDNTTSFVGFIINFTLIGFQNFVHLTFVIQFQTVKKSIQQAVRKFNKKTKFVK